MYRCVWPGQSLHLLLFWKNRHRFVWRYGRLCIFESGMAETLAQTSEISNFADCGDAEADLLSRISGCCSQSEYIHKCKRKKCDCSNWNMQIERICFRSDFQLCRAVYKYYMIFKTITGEWKHTWAFLHLEYSWMKLERWSRCRDCKIYYNLILDIKNEIRVKFNSDDGSILKIFTSNVSLHWI